MALIFLLAAIIAAVFYGLNLDKIWSAVIALWFLGLSILTKLGDIEDLIRKNNNK